VANQVDYFEIGTPNPESSRAFYGGLFGWTFGEPSPQAYSMVNGGAGGLWDTSATAMGNWAVFYVHVDDVAASIAHAEQLGATVAIPLIDNGDITFAHLVDPDGNRFAIWRRNDA
jgi:predicted enzyme related to lactoylglutathione lyase